MKKLSFLGIHALLLILFSLQALAERAADAPELAPERVVFHTNLGDIAVGLYGKLAPLHTAQILKMADLGVYNAATIFRVEPGFVAQVQNFDAREVPLLPRVIEQIQKVPAEFNHIHHVRGLLSMARYEDPNSAEASFSFMLGEASHLDGKYTVFGEVLAGDDVLRLIETLPRDANNVPLEPIYIDGTETVTATQLQEMRLSPAHTPNQPNDRMQNFILIFAVLAFTGTVLLALYKTIFDKPPVRTK